jgi:hypothetical protein
VSAVKEPTWLALIAPECMARGCFIGMRLENFRPETIYQHGDNPALFLGVALGTPMEETRQRFRAFAERCHRYEDGVSVEETL